MSAKMTTEYEFADLTSDYASIKGNTIIKTPDKESFIDVNGMPVKYDLQGSMISIIKVDKKTGWIIEATINQEINGDAYIKDNPKMLKGMKLSMTIKNESAIRN